MTDPAALPNFPPPANEHPLRGRVLDVLTDLSAAPNIDGDGDVAFTVNEQQLFARCVEAEPALLRVFGQWAIEDRLLEDRTHLLEVSNEVSLNLSCVTTGIAERTLVVSSEHLVGQSTDLSAVVQIAVQAILQGVHVWHQRALGIEPTDEDGSADGAPEGGH